MDPNGTWTPDKVERRHAGSLVPASGADGSEKMASRPAGALSGPGLRDRGGAREAGRAGGRSASGFCRNHRLSCVVQDGLGLGGCGALDSESELGAQPPEAAGSRHLR